MNLVGRVATLRPLTVEHAALTLGWRLGARARFLQPGSRTVEEQRRWLEARPADEFNWLIDYRGTPVGMIALHDINGVHGTAIMGRLLVGEPELAGSAPVAFDAERIVCDIAFDELGLHRIYGPIMKDNAAMIRSRRYLGYAQEGVLREHYLYAGVRKDAVMFGLLASEYRSVCRPRLVALTDLFLRFSGDR